MMEVVRHTVATLVASVSDDDLVAALSRLYWADQDKQAASYLEVLARLRTMMPASTTMSCVLAREWSDDNPPEPLIHIVGREMGDDTRWAIEFRPWAEWLGMAVEADPALELSEADMLANILYEMTFVGWDDEEIAEQWQVVIDAHDDALAHPERLIEVKPEDDLMKNDEK